MLSEYSDRPESGIIHKKCLADLVHRLNVEKKAQRWDTAKAVREIFIK